MSCWAASTTRLHDVPCYAHLAARRPQKHTLFALTRHVCDLKLRRLCSHNVTRHTASGCTCQAHKGTNADSSMLGNRTTHKLSARQRRALFNDFTLTIPFGGLNCVTGFISLRFKLQGGWTGVLVSLAGALIFTLGSMSHHNTYEGTESSWAPTLASAAVAAALAQAYYQKAIAGVAGTMVMSIVSAIVSLGLVYNVEAGGNKPETRAAADDPAPATGSSLAPANPRQGWTDAGKISTSSALNQIQPEAQSGQSSTSQQAAVLESGTFPWGANVHTAVALTGAVLYAQGLWGLWGETVGYSPAGLAAAAASGLATLGIARALLPQSPSDQTDIR